MDWTNEAILRPVRQKHQSLSKMCVVRKFEDASGLLSTQAAKCHTLEFPVDNDTIFSQCQTNVTVSVLTFYERKLLS